MSEKATMSSDLFTKHVHHQNLRVLYIIQNIFNNAKNHRALSLNVNYIVLFKNPRDKAQMSNLERQMFPRKPKIFQEVFDDATVYPYSYLLMDFRQDTPENLRLQTKIFPGEAQVVYVPKF